MCWRHSTNWARCCGIRGNKVVPCSGQLDKQEDGSMTCGKVVRRILLEDDNICDKCLAILCKSVGKLRRSIAFEERQAAAAGLSSGD